MLALNYLRTLHPHTPWIKWIVDPLCVQIPVCTPL